jgi:hypothetical protein
VGVVYFRVPRRIILPTGPPFSKKSDGLYAEYLDSFAGCKVICGGTSAEKHGAASLAQMLRDSDDISFLVGTKINEAHQDSSHPAELGLRRNIVKRVANVLSLEFHIFILCLHCLFSGHKGKDPPGNLCGLFWGLRSIGAVALQSRINALWEK